MKKRNYATRIGLLLVLLCLCAGGLFGCAADKTDKTAANDEKYRVFCTAFPVYDWLKNVTAEAENIELVLLDTHGADLHSYQPAVADMTALADSDLVVYIGGESDKWAADAVKNAGTDVKGVSLLALLGDKVKTEQTVEGMEAEEHAHGSAEEETPEIDEHVWLSVKNAAFFTEHLTELLCEADASEAEFLREASNAYTDALTKLDKAYAEAVQSARLDVFVVCDRFPFRYLADDYALAYYAAFPGCSAETDAGFDTVIFLANKIDELHLTHVAVTESGTGAVAKAVLENAAEKDVAVVTLDSLQAVSAEDIAHGKSYLSAMEENLAALKALLS